MPSQNTEITPDELWQGVQDTIRNGEEVNGGDNQSQAAIDTEKSLEEAIDVAINGVPKQ